MEKLTPMALLHKAREFSSDMSVTQALRQLIAPLAVLVIMPREHPCDVFARWKILTLGCI